MHAELEDWKNGWYGVHLGLSTGEIDVLIERLKMLRADPDQHFHLSSTYQGGGGLGDVTVYVQDPSEPSNMEAIGSKAFAPGGRPRGLTP
ncbi:hypothetical protein P12x_005852 [Tundrisphaera lichenicola]|uniref:hypothetical protein n=1 Tax=Tundrisphaera lichenicola TaxID=2029860 RepID=UPI003EBA5EEA